jgi:hypothetical protein
MLSAYVYLPNPYEIAFSNVTQASALIPGATVSVRAILIDASITCGATYPLEFQGTYSSGSGFDENVTAPLACLGTG